jgi:hypothetical protein
MCKTRFSTLLVMLLIVAFLMISTNSVYAYSASPPPPDKQSQIDALLQQLKEATEREIANGEVESYDEYGVPVFTDAAAERLNTLHNEIARKIDDIISRSPEERRGALAEIRRIDSSNVEYSHTSKMPYNTNLYVEVYNTSSRDYYIDARDDSILQFGPTSQAALGYDYTSKAVKEDLEQLAIEFIKSVAGNVDVDTLVPNHSDKSEMVFFFRWEDHSLKLESGEYPFIVVGISSGGEIGSFTNTLNMYTVKSSSYRPLFVSGWKIYANGGDYWSKSGISHSIRNNDGWCYLWGGAWCTPKNFYYVQESASVTYTGTWNNTDYYQYSDVWAFIPWINATAICAEYKVRFYYGTYSDCVPQAWYSDEWADVLKLYNLYTVAYVRLTNKPAEGSVNPNRQFAFDEINIIY